MESYEIIEKTMDLRFVLKCMRYSNDGIPIEQTVLEQRVKVKIPSGEEWWWVPVLFCEEGSTPCDLEE